MDFSQEKSFIDLCEMISYRDNEKRTSQEGNLALVPVSKSPSDISTGICLFYYSSIYYSNISIFITARDLKIVPNGS